jgi:queuine/archaeosine tRNA-ribosyltransferase
MKMMSEIRESIGNNRFMEYKGQFLEQYMRGDKRKEG